MTAPIRVVGINDAGECVIAITQDACLTVRYTVKNGVPTVDYAEVDEEATATRRALDNFLDDSDAEPPPVFLTEGPETMQ